MREELENVISIGKRCVAEKNSNNKKMFLKCYRMYILNHIILRKGVFQITFRAKHIYNFSTRCNNWKNYIWSVITHKEGTYVPIHSKCVEIEEGVLINFLQENHMEVISEDYYCDKLEYEVVVM